MLQCQVGIAIAVVRDAECHGVTTNLLGGRRPLYDGLSINDARGNRRSLGQIRRRKVEWTLIEVACYKRELQWAVGHRDFVADPGQLRWLIGRLRREHEALLLR